MSRRFVAVVEQVYEHRSTSGLGIIAKFAFEPPPGMAFVSIDEPGFNGKMSRYETTNAQYCHFLNAALASGDIAVGSNDVVGATDPHAGQLYYDGDGLGYSSAGATNGGAPRIHYSGGVFSVDSGLNNRPVTLVSWYPP